MCYRNLAIHDSIFNQEILPTNYKIYRRDRNRRGGGVLIAVRNEIPSGIIDTLELITIEVELAKKFQITCLYIPPASCDQYQQEVLSSIGSLSTLGDFNCPDINWSTLTAPSPFSSALCDQFYSLNLVQIVTDPTHKLGNILDLIATNVPDCLANLTVNTA